MPYKFIQEAMLPLFQAFVNGSNVENLKISTEAVIKQCVIFFRYLFLI